MIFGDLVIVRVSLPGRGIVPTRHEGSMFGSSFSGFAGDRRDFGVWRCREVSGRVGSGLVTAAMNNLTAGPGVTYWGGRARRRVAGAVQGLLPDRRIFPHRAGIIRAVHGIARQGGLGESGVGQRQCKYGG